MKQKKLIGLALACLLVLSGCSGTVKDDGKYVVASIDGANVYADDIYDELATSTTGKQMLFSYVLDQLVQAYYPVTSDMETSADEIIEEIEDEYDSYYGDSAEEYLESALSSNGYESMDDYRESLIQSLQYAEFLKQYVKDNFDEVFDDYYDYESPRIVSIIKVAMDDPTAPSDEESEALEEVESLLDTDKTFGEIAADYSDDDTASAKGNLGVVDSTSDLADTYGDDVETAILEIEEGEVSEAIQGDDGYYFIYCTSTDKDTIKAELEVIDLDSPLLVYDDYMVYLALSTYELTYADDDIQETIEDILNENLEYRDELREEE
ncbi:MAG: peptidylprolyl isomerase [Erysipelotrichaceae bacterium]|nr:peptidylprolyl isomerase [Erysipelotrichaceae bacterium]